MQIVKLDNCFYAVLGIDNHEDAGNMSYDRTYKLVRCQDSQGKLLNKIEFTNPQVIKKRVSGFKLPEELSSKVYYKFKSSIAEDNGTIVHTYYLQGNVKWHPILSKEGIMSWSEIGYILETSESNTPIISLQHLTNKIENKVLEEEGIYTLKGQEVRITIEVKTTKY